MRVFSVTLLLLCAGVNVDGLCLVQAGENNTSASEARTDESSQALPCPSCDELCKLIKHGRSIISAKGRNRISELIRQLDKVHKQRLEESRIAISDVPIVKKKVVAQTRQLPRFTPTCERAVLYAMHAQVTMLDRLLFDSNEPSALTLRDSRSKRKILDPNEYIFKDSRDRVVREYVENVKHIYELQKSLGVSGKLKLAFPSQLRSMKEVEKYFEERLGILIKRSKSLLVSQS